MVQPQGEMNEQSMVMNTPSETNNKNNITEFLKPSMRGLFKTINGMTETTYMLSMIGKSWWPLHINFLLKIVVKKYIFHIKLIEWLGISNIQGNENSNISHFDCWSKSLLIINTMLIINAILLRVSSNKTDLAVLNQPIRMDLDFVDTLTVDRTLLGGEGTRSQVCVSCKVVSFSFIASW